MRLPAFRFLNDRQAARDFSRLEPAFREIVFYSEGPGDWPHLGPVVLSLLRENGTKVSYLTSDPRDPGLAIRDELFRGYMIGSGSTRTVLFRKIECRQFVMTIPDLQQMWLKRSVHPVRYVYLFHSTNSTHTVYRKGAFDAYDTIMCVGPHHVREIRRTEEHYGLRPKELVEAGSVKLDSVLAELSGVPERTQPNDPPVVLVAPSWGQGSLIEMPIGEEVIRTLLGADLRTILRLHPMTVHLKPHVVAGIRQAFGSHPLFALEEDMSATESWLRSDMMISDWSGAATEYAFALGKPVIFIDTPRKIRNPEWRAIGLPGFEDFIRKAIGPVIGVDNVASLPAHVVRIDELGRERPNGARDLAERWIFNPRKSVAVTLDRLVAN